MAGSNKPSNVNGALQCRGGQSVFQCRQYQAVDHQDSVHLGSGNCDSEHPPSRTELLNPKDSSRRKRVNRSAKLKQCKLDARREQWLSQGSQGKQGKMVQQQHLHNQHQHQKCERHHKAGDVECIVHEKARHSHGHGGGSHSNVNKCVLVGPPARYLHSSASTSNNECNLLKSEASVKSRELMARLPKYFGVEEPRVGGDNKQGSAVNGWSSSDVSKSRSDSSCASSSYTGSGSEDNNESPDAEDDWESAFDALHVQSSQHRSEGSCKGSSSECPLHIERKELLDKKQSGIQHYRNPDVQSTQSEPEYRCKASGSGGRKGIGGRAWRPDDMCRPPTLPRLSKQHMTSSHQNINRHQGWGGMHGNMWGVPPVTPSYCPICTEELDMTDSSYMPCACGFQLCLFCYHRISSDDGRCPGCRKAYNPDLVVKLSRSSSVWLRV